MAEAKFTPEAEQIILDLLADGKSLRAVCERDDIPVTEAAVRKHAIADEDFGTQYARAREIGYDSRAERAVDDAKKPDVDPQKGRLAFDAERWYLGKMKPKTYGEATLLKHADADGNKLDLPAVIEQRRRQVVKGRSGNQA